MSRLIIENKSAIDDATALRVAAQVVDMGRISGKKGKEQYCYCTTFNRLKVLAVARKGKASDTITIEDSQGLVTFVQADLDGTTNQFKEDDP